MSSKRIAKEFAEASQSPPDGVSVALADAHALHTWHVVLAAPPASPYYPGRFALLVSLPVEYPFKPPALRFVTRIYHPNVTNDALGNVCLAILKPDLWKPSTKVLAVLDAVRALLVEPQPDDPLEERIAEEFRNDRGAWDANVRQYVQRYALAQPVFPPAAAAAAAAASSSS